MEGLDKTTLNFLYELAAEQDKTVDEVISDVLKDYLNNK